RPALDGDVDHVVLVLERDLVARARLRPALGIYDRVTACGVAELQKDLVIGDVAGGRGLRLGGRGLRAPRGGRAGFLRGTAPGNHQRQRKEGQPEVSAPTAVHGPSIPAM